MLLQQKFCESALGVCIFVYLVKSAIQDCLLYQRSLLKSQSSKKQSMLHASEGVLIQQCKSLYQGPMRSIHILKQCARLKIKKVLST